jgi:hypothetical protein
MRAIRFLAAMSCLTICGFAFASPKAGMLLVVSPDLSKANRLDAESFGSTFHLLGVPVSSCALTGLKLPERSFICLPNAAARHLKQADLEVLMSAVKNGKVLISDGPSPLIEALHIKTATPHPVFHVQDRLDKNLEMRWPDHPLVAAFDAAEDDNIRWLYVDSETARPLGLEIRFGKGKIVLFAGLYDGLSGKGFSRYPDLPWLLVHELNLRPPAKKSLAEAYFDPGNRGAHADLKGLAAKWRRWGIRRIYAATWDMQEYDYASLIRTAHRYGVAVDAWFEWPHVTNEFWKVNPECREKTAALTDARIFWRSLVNFENPACREKVFSLTREFLEQYRWDGVDFAEIYFEPAGGTDEAPDQWTPMNPDARKDMQKALGFDPVLIFQPGSAYFWETHPREMDAFYAARTKLNTARVRGALEFLTAERKKHPSWDSVLAFIDVAGHPDLAKFSSVDLASHLDLARRYGVMPQIEDSSLDWPNGPGRYEKLTSYYDQVWRASYGVDINVVPAHTSVQAMYPTGVPVGTEFFQLWRSAYGHGNRVCVYAEDTVREMDWEILPYVMGAAAAAD